MECYGFSYGDYRFGVDNRKVTVDEANMIINPNLSSIKGFGDKVAGELWEIANQNPKTFIDAAILIRDSSINKALMEKLIKLNYFERNVKETFPSCSQVQTWQFNNYSSLTFKKV